MPEFGRRSNDNLKTCHPELQRLFKCVVQHYDCSVICGHRNQEEQDAAYANKSSTKKFPMSTHNHIPSKGIDVIPYPFAPEDWKDLEKFRDFSGFVKGVAAALEIPIRSGGDWDMDNDLDDQDFIDLPHFEYIGEY